MLKFFKRLAFVTIFFSVSISGFSSTNRCLLYPTVFDLKKGDIMSGEDTKKLIYDPVFSFQLIGNSEYHAKILYTEVWKNGSIEFDVISDTSRFSQSYLSQMSFSPVILHTQYKQFKFVDYRKKKGKLYYQLQYTLEISISSNQKDKELLLRVEKDTTYEALNYRDAAYKATAHAYLTLIQDTTALKNKITGRFVSALESFKGEPIQLTGRAESLKDLKENIKRVKQSVWTVETASSIGSAFCIDGKGLFVTNYHVVDDSDSVTIIDGAGKKIRAKVLKTNPVFDLALLSCEKGTYPFISLQKDTIYEDGESVLAIGTPWNKEFSQTVSKGIISGLRDFYARKYIQIDVPINPGNSGGPLINENGMVLGMVTASYRPGKANSIGFAIPSYVILKNLNLN